MVELTGFSGPVPVLEKVRSEVIAPVFVVGSPRSGTTVLGKCLAAHQGLAGDEESLFLLHLWEIFAQRHQGLFRKGWAPLSGFLSAEDLLEEMGRFSDRVFGALCKRLGKPRVVDHTPVYGLLAPFINVLYPDAVYVHIVRDGRAVVSSLVNSAAQGFKWADAEVESLGAMWSDIVSMTRERCRDLGDGRYIEVRYEDLCSEPERVLRSLCTHLSLGWNDAVLAPLSQSHARPARAEFALAQTREGQLTLTPRNADTGWGAMWSPQSKTQFLKSAGATMIELGYLTDARELEAAEGEIL